MIEWLEWFKHMENTKPFALVLFFITFVLIILYLIRIFRLKMMM